MLLLRFTVSSPLGLALRFAPVVAASSVAISVLKYESMLPLEAAVTFAMNALCFAANSGLLNLEDLLALPSLMSDWGDSEPAGVAVPDATDEFRALKLLREVEDGSPDSMPRPDVSSTLFE